MILQFHFKVLTVIDMGQNLKLVPEEETVGQGNYQVLAHNSTFKVKKYLSNTGLRKMSKLVLKPKLVTTVLTRTH